MSNLDGDASSGNDGRLDQSPATIPYHNSVADNGVFVSTLRSGNDVTSISPPNNLSDKIPGDDGDDNTWKIVVGVLVPLAILIVIIIIVAYIMYRRKYPVRMIIGREFAKIRNPNYNRPLSEANLVREDGDVYFSSQRASQVLNLDEYNPVNQSIQFDNMGYQRDEEEVVEDEEDSAEKEFRLRKGWLFKRYSQEDQVQIINENQYNDNIAKLSSDSDHGSGSESSDIEAMLSLQKITPIPSRKQNRTSSSDKENRRSLSNVSVSSKDIKVNVQEAEIKLNPPFFIANKALLRVAGKQVIDVKATRSQSLTSASPEVEARPRSFSVDPSKSARRYSARSESISKSESDEEIQNFARQYVTASVVEVIVNRNISLYPSVSSLSTTMRDHAMSFSSVNSNPHLVTDLDETDSDTEKYTSEKEKETEVDETDSIIYMTSKNNGEVTTNDLNPPLEEKENAEPTESTQDFNRNAYFASEQHDSNSANTGETSDDFIGQNTKNHVSNHFVEKQYETVDSLYNCSAETLDHTKERDTSNETDSASFIVLETESSAAKESTSVEKQEEHVIIITDSNLQYDRSIETHDDKMITTITPNNSEINKGTYYYNEQEDKQKNITAIEYGDDDSILVLNRHPSNQNEDTFQSQSSKTLEQSSNVLVTDYSQAQDTDNVSHEDTPRQKREEDLNVVVEIYSSTSVVNTSENVEPSVLLDMRASDDTTGLIESQDNSSHSAETKRHDTLMNQRADFVHESEQTNSSIPSGIKISKEYQDNPLTLIDSDKQFSAIVRNEPQNTNTEEQNDSSVVSDSSSAINAVKVNENEASGDEQHISHLDAPVENIDHSNTNLSSENQNSILNDQSKHSSKQADTVSEVIIIEGKGDENLSDDSDQESSTSNSSSDGQFEEYSFIDNSKVTKYDQYKETNYTPASNLDMTQIGFLNQRDMNYPEDVGVDIVHSNGQKTTSLEVGAQDIDHLTSSQFLPADNADNDGSLHKDDSGHGKYKDKSADEKQNHDLFRDKSENLVDKKSEIKHQVTEKVNFKVTTLHNDGDSSISSSDISDVENISLSDIDDPTDLEPGLSAINKMDNDSKNLVIIEEVVNESLANLQNIGSQQMTSSDQVSPKEEIVHQPVSQSRLRIIPTVQFSEGSSDSDDEYNGAKPSVNLDSHPLYNPTYKHEDDKMRNEFTLEDIAEALNSDEKTLGMADISLANQNSEHDDLSFSFEIAKTYRLEKENGDDKDDDDIDV